MPPTANVLDRFLEVATQIIERCQTPPDRLFANVLKEIAPSEDVLDTAKRVADLCNDAIEFIVLNIDLDKREPFIEKFVNFRNCFNITSMASSTSSFPFKPQDLRELRLAFHGIKLVVKDAAVTDEQRNEVKAKLDELEDRVRTSGLDDRLQSVLLDGIRYLREALENFRWDGEKGLEEAFDRFVGRVRRAANDDYSTNEKFYDLVNILLALEISLGLISNIAALPSTLKLILPH